MVTIYRGVKEVTLGMKFSKTISHGIVKTQWNAEHNYNDISESVTTLTF